jgi:hypothetical protein
MRRPDRANALPRTMPRRLTRGRSVRSFGTLGPVRGAPGTRTPCSDTPVAPHPRTKSYTMRYAACVCAPPQSADAADGLRGRGESAVAAVWRSFHPPTGAGEPGRWLGSTMLCCDRREPRSGAGGRPPRRTLDPGGGGRATGHVARAGRLRNTRP